jgi:glycosyltransferase involved in cell wall biosynthesis
MVNVLALYDGCGPSYHRIFVPLSAMPSINVVFTNHIGEKSPVKSCNGFDVVFVNRLFPANKLSDILNQRKQLGFRLIVDLDDHWDLDPHHILYEHYKKTNLSTYILHLVEKADGVSVTHERLAEAVSTYNKKIWVLPNAIDNQHPQFKQEHTPGEKVRLFWAGGVTHEKDIAILRNPIKRVYSDAYLRDKCMMVMGGFQQNDPTWSAMASSYTNGLQMPGVLLDGKPVEKYYELYQYADICLIPLKKSKFNRNKSNLKILEAANMGIPVVVSAVDPYLGFPNELVNYVRTQTDWYLHIRKLVRDREFARQQGQALKEYVERVYNFDKINEARCRMLTGQE